MPWGIPGTEMVFDYQEGSRWNGNVNNLKAIVIL